MPAEAVELKHLLHYELRSSSRYRRFVSLVAISKPRNSADIRSVLGSCIRTSDEFFATNFGGAILMGETDQGGALRAVERFKEQCLHDEDIDMRFAVVNFPFDGAGADVLLGTAEQRLEKASKMGRGAVVYN
jgi:hypothetical protein